MENHSALARESLINPEPGFVSPLIEHLGNLFDAHLLEQPS